MKIEIDFWEFQSSEFFFKKVPKNQIFLYLVPVSSQKYGGMFYNYVFHLWLIARFWPNSSCG
jgi:hypothetical protein